MTRRPCPHRLTRMGISLLLIGWLAEGVSARAQPTQPRSLAIVSPATVETLLAKESGADVEPMADQTGRFWRVSTRNSGGYPGVFVSTRRGVAWDLRRWGRLEAVVYNLEPIPLKVILVANNHGSNGRERCSADSAIIPPKSKGRVTVDLGQWHGRAARGFDSSRVEAIGILIERPERRVRIEVGTIRAVMVDRRGFEELAKTEAYRKLERPLGRGINLGNALDAPSEGAWGYRLEAAHFTAIAKAGFDFVRLPVRWSAHMKSRPPYTIDESFARRVDWALEQARANRLKIVLNVHHFEEIMREPDRHRERFLAIWRQLAQRYREAPESVAFELLNEPSGRLGASFWNELLADAIRLIRRTNPKRMIVVGPVRYNSIAALDSLEVPRDPNLIVTVHYYDPFEFTHQGASWVGGDSQEWLGTTWSGTGPQKAAIRRDLDAALRWAVEHRCRLLLGEFGAIAKADPLSRARWTQFVAEEAWKRKMGYAYWAFDAGFDAYDVDHDRWHREVLEALIPRDHQ